MTTTPQTEIPDVINRYLVAQDAKDVAGTLATFTPTASVADDGRTYDGIDEIGRWLNHVSSEYTVQRAILGATATGADRWIVTNMITGNFPGGTVQLAYEFDLRDGRIDRLKIAPTASERVE